MDVSRKSNPPKMSSLGSWEHPGVVGRLGSSASYTAQGTNVRTVFVGGKAQLSADLTQERASGQQYQRHDRGLHCNSLHTHSCRIYLITYIKNTICIYHVCMTQVSQYTAYLYKCRVHFKHKGNPENQSQ